MRTIFWRNLKLEGFLLSLIIIAVLVFKFSAWQLPKCFIDYLSDGRIAGITSILAIAIGIYMTVATVIATSITGISRELLTSKMDLQLLAKVSVGVIACIFSVFMGTLYPIKTSYSYIIYTGISMLAIVSFLKFIVTIVLFFKTNISYIAKSIDSDDEFKTNVSISLENIEDKIKKL